MGSTSSYYKNLGNPVLGTFISFEVQPYWLFVVELLFLQLLQRIYSLIESSCKKKKKHIYIALELSILGTKRTGVSLPKYSVLDFILSLISVGHFGYAIYLQTKCTNQSKATAWRCYNAFGYQLYNYVLPSLISVLVEAFVQLGNMIKASKVDPNHQVKRNPVNYIKWALLISTIVLNSLVFVAFIPFFISNVFPMLIAYSWVLICVLAALVLAYATFITVVVNALRQCADCGCVYFLKFFGTHCVVGLQVFGCLVLSMAYNYSQYSFFGADYTSVIWCEYQSRDTTIWYQRLTNDSESLIQNLLTPF
ncbi:unnamed protein product [Adineta ricciae]|uniref:Uncharacterized protein n=1 Tax=Adineta ricciae TaxID=249248 RepID=A0A814RFY6_ADIRI|nr:unnamed protein product [Adineta ricciae]